MKRERVVAGWLATGAGIALSLVTMTALAHAPAAHTPMAHKPPVQAPVAHAPAAAGAAARAVKAVPRAAPVRAVGQQAQRVAPLRTAGPHRAPRDAVLGGPSGIDARHLVRR